MNQFSKTGIVAAVMGVAVGAAIYTAIQSRPKEDYYVLSTGKKCPKEGTPPHDRERALNVLKNRTEIPKESDFDTSCTLTALLAPGDDTDRWDESKAARIQGYCIEVKPGGIESCNCEASAEADRDTHLEISTSPDAKPSEVVICEVTPRWRKSMKQQGEDWSTPALEKSLKHHWVELSGYLFNDLEHTNASENTAPHAKNVWRATSWELHPLIKITIIDRPGG
jgi:hypothetical protein